MCNTNHPAWCESATTPRKLSHSSSRRIQGRLVLVLGRLMRKMGLRFGLSVLFVLFLIDKAQPKKILVVKRHASQQKFREALPDRTRMGVGQVSGSEQTGKVDQQFGQAEEALLPSLVQRFLATSSWLRREAVRLNNIFRREEARPIQQYLPIDQRRSQKANVEGSKSFTITLEHHPPSSSTTQSPQELLIPGVFLLRDVMFNDVFNEHVYDK